MTRASQLLSSILCFTLWCLMATTFAAEQPAVGVVNGLLKGELAAAETYGQALEKIRSQAGAEQLSTFLNDHQQAASRLIVEVERMGGQPSTDSGAWGTWAKTVMGSAKLIGDKAALAALKSGEESAVKDYEEALADKEVPDTTKTLIRDVLLPKGRDHVQALAEMVAALDQKGSLQESWILVPELQG